MHYEREELQSQWDEGGRRDAVRHVEYKRVHCPPGCERAAGHVGFHTTSPDIAKREDAADLAAFHTRFNARFAEKQMP